jgi:hypothetical protein
MSSSHSGFSSSGFSGGGASGGGVEVGNVILIFRFISKQINNNKNL